MKNKFRIAVAFIIAAVMVVFCVGTLVNVWNRLADTLSEDAETEHDEDIWPLGGEITERLGAVERIFNNGIFRQDELIAVNGLIQRSMGNRVIDDTTPANTIYKLDNGQLTFVYPRCDVKKRIESYKELYDFARDNNTTMLFVAAPGKILRNNEDQLPEGVEDYSNDNMNKFLSGLWDGKMAFYDLRDSLKLSGMSNEEFFFNTDHHWRIESAFWAFGQVINEVNRRYSMDIDPDGFYRDIANYEVTTYPRSFLGSQGKRVGPLYVEPDDFSFIFPKFDTSLIKIEYKKGGREAYKDGDFVTAITKSNFLDMDAPITTNHYAAYLGSGSPLITIVNRNEHGKVLIVLDSFGRPFASFMSQCFAITHIVDLRYEGNVSIKELIERENYDRVIFLYSPGSFKDFDTNARLFEFD